MALRNYNNTTVAGALTAPASPSDVFMSVTEFAGYPAPPFTATVERSLPTEEVVLVTAVNAGTLTVVRGYNGTAAQTHLAGAPIEHTAVALDFSEANSHVNATDNVHGIVGGLVGDEAPQTLLDKTLISPVVEADVAAGDAIVAYVPEGAEARNLFRGMSPAGDDVFAVDSSGQAIAARLHSTGNSETDGDSQVDGNQTVGGNLTVTGTSAFTGAVTVPVQAAAAAPARKEYVDALGTATSTANTVVRRDGNGNTAIDAITLTDAPTVAGHATRKDYVDGINTALDARLDALEANTDLAVTEVTYESGFAAETASPPWRGVRFWRKNDVVTVTGALRATTAKASGTDAFFLPVGCRPPEVMQLLASNASFGFVVKPTGAVTLTQPMASGNTVAVAGTFVIA